MRGSAEDFYTILKIEEPSYEQVSDLLCDLEMYLSQGKIPKNYEEVLDLVIDYIRMNK